MSPVRKKDGGAHVGLFRPKLFTPKLYGQKPAEAKKARESAESEEEWAEDLFPDKAPGSPLDPLIAHHFAAGSNRLHSVGSPTNWSVSPSTCF